jgi:hypothetical protein
MYKNCVHDEHEAECKPLAMAKSVVDKTGWWLFTFFSRFAHNERYCTVASTFASLLAFVAAGYIGTIWWPASHYTATLSTLIGHSLDGRVWFGQDGGSSEDNSC